MKYHKILTVHTANRRRHHVVPITDEDNADDLTLFSDTNIDIEHILHIIEIQ